MYSSCSLYYTQDLMHKILFDTGKGDKRRLIDVKKVAEVEGREICNVLPLPAIHAFTGCEITSAFVKRGKTWPLNLLNHSMMTFSTPSYLSEDLPMCRSPYEKLEHFVCTMYSMRSVTKDVNILRHAKFAERFTPRQERCFQTTMALISASFHRAKMH